MHAHARTHAHTHAREREREGGGEGDRQRQIKVVHCYVKGNKFQWVLKPRPLYTEASERDDKDKEKENAEETAAPGEKENGNGKKEEEEEKEAGTQEGKEKEGIEKLLAGSDTMVIFPEPVSDHEEMETQEGEHQCAYLCIHV